MKITMMSGIGNPPPPVRLRSTGRGTPLSSTLRPSAIRPMMRVGARDRARPRTGRCGTAGAMYVAAGLAGEAVGDPLFEAVADFDPDPPLLHRDEDQQRRCPCRASPMPRPRFSNSLTAYSRMSRTAPTVSTVATTTTSPAGRLQRADHRVELLFVGRVDDVGEVVDRLRQLGKRRLGRGPAEAGHDEQPAIERDDVATNVERRTPNGTRRRSITRLSSDRRTP